MSEYEKQYNEADYIAPLGFIRLGLNWIGAATSVALVVGLIYWVVQLGTRDPNEIPIIRAMNGPARTQPENPGGSQASHQGLAVNAVQSEGNAAKPAKTVVLAPKQQPLAPEDKTQGQLTKIKSALRPEPVAKPPEPEKQPAAEQAVVAAPEVESTVQDASLITETIKLDQKVTVIAAGKYAPLKSLIPRQRPDGLVKPIEAATAIASQSEVPITKVPVGTRLVQLGAYDSTEIAAKEWDKLIGKHGDLLAGKKRLIQIATSGGREFYRLRAIGFETVEDSRNLCSALLARGTPCIPVSAR